MHVHDLTSLEVLVVEVAQHELAAGHIGQELLLGDLGVLSMALNEVLLLLLVVVFHLRHPHLADAPHDLLLLVISELFILQLVVVVAAMQQVALCRWIVEIAFLVLELLLHLDGLVVDGLLHDHVREDLGGHILHGRGRCCMRACHNTNLNLITLL